METRKITFYKNKQGSVECQYDDTRKQIKNKTAIILELSEPEVDRIMHTKDFKDIQGYLTKMYEENAPEEVKYTIISCSQEIKDIIDNIPKNK